MLFKTSKKPKGITLVELLVYLTIFGMIFLTAIRFMLSVTINNQNAEQRKEIERASAFITEHIGDTFTKTNTIDIANSIFTTDAGRLRLTNAAGYYQYSVNGTRLQIDNNGTAFYLTNPDIVIVKFNLDRINSKSGTPSGVRLTLQIQSLKDSKVQKNIQTAFTFK